VVADAATGEPVHVPAGRVPFCLLLCGRGPPPPRPENPSTYPHRLDLRTDQTGTITEFDPLTGRETDTEVGIAIRPERDDVIRVEMRFIEKGVTQVRAYRFRLKSDDTLVMHDETGGLVFTRQK
jgi:hypothetical protein